MLSILEKVSKNQRYALTSEPWNHNPKPQGLQKTHTSEIAILQLDADEYHRRLGISIYRGTSLIRKRLDPGPYGRPFPGALQRS